MDDLLPDISTHDLSMRLIRYRTISINRHYGKRDTKEFNEQLEKSFVLFPAQKCCYYQTDTEKANKIKRNDFMSKFRIKKDPEYVKKEIEIMERMLEERHLAHKIQYNEKRKIETKLCVCCNKPVNKKHYARHIKSQSHNAKQQQQMT